MSFSVDFENVRLICRLASLIDCVINHVIPWAGSVSCTLGADGVIVGIAVCPLGTAWVVLSGVANDFAMAECWWMACSVTSTSCRISSAPLGLVMSLIAFAQSAIVFMILSAWVMEGFVICL